MDFSAVTLPCTDICKTLKMCQDVFVGSWREKCLCSSCSKIRQASDTRQTNSSEDLLSPSLSNRKALLCLCERGGGKCFIQNHCYVWEPLLLSTENSQAISLPPYSFPVTMRGLQFAGETSDSFSSMSQGTFTNLHSFHLPEFRTGTESQSPSQK